MSWDSVGKSLGSVVDERLSNPLVSSFLIAWSAVNYKFFVILFSKNTVTDTFTLIKEICFPDLNAILFNGVAVPFAAALLYVFALPPISLWFFKEWKKSQAEMDVERDKYDREQRLPLAKSQELRRKNAELEGTVDELKETLRISKADLRNASVEMETLKEQAKNQVQLNNDLQGLRRQIVGLESDLAKTRATNDLQQRQLAESKQQLVQAKSAIEVSEITPQLLRTLFSGLTPQQVQGIMTVLQTDRTNRLAELLSELAKSSNSFKDIKP